ncbi:MAG: cbb3-type cytochrome oxidase assembly protein CcoS [Rubrivivax sp.]|nr:cbb3-type cytochrome oxidase assembly protein CcoS [Rubrivivax sp.]
MEVVYLLVLLAVVVAAVIIWAFFWAVRSGQFDDLEGPAHRILMDRDEPGADRDAPAGTDRRTHPSQMPPGPG